MKRCIQTFQHSGTVKVTLSQMVVANGNVSSKVLCSACSKVHCGD